MQATLRKKANGSMLSMETRGHCFTDRDAMMSDTENCTVTSFRERTFGSVNIFAMGQQKRRLKTSPSLKADADRKMRGTPSASERNSHI
jgi:hypothetical protein